MKPPIFLFMHTVHSYVPNYPLLYQQIQRIFVIMEI